MKQLDQAKEGLALSKKTGMRKINFAGGEPFLYSQYLGQVVDFCKKELRLESVSIVTNRSLVKEKFLETHAILIFLFVHVVIRTVYLIERPSNLYIQTTTVGSG